MDRGPDANFRPFPQWSRTDLLLALALTVIAAMLRVIGLNEGLWTDEILTLIRYVPLSPAEIISNYDSRNNHVLYSLMAHFSVAWFGESNWALRLPAALAGIATIPAAYYFGRQIASRNEAFIATTLLAVSYHHVWFSQNARGYSGLLLGSVLLSILFVRLAAIAKPGCRIVVGYAIIAALSSWIHLSGALVVVAHAITWFALASALAGKHRIAFSWAPPTALLLSGCLTVLLYAPLLTSLTTMLLADSPAEGLPWASWAWLLEELKNAANQGIPGGWPVAGFAVLLTAVGAGSYLRQGLLPAALLLVPAIVTAAAVLCVSEVFFPRFLLASMVFILLIATRGGFVLARRISPAFTTRRVTVIGALVALAAVTRVPDAWGPKQDFESAVEFIDAHRANGDAVVCIQQDYGQFHTYLGMECDKVTSAGELKALEEAHARTWFAYSTPTLFQHMQPELWSEVQQDYFVIATFSGTLHGGEIVVQLNAGKSRSGTNGQN